MLLCELTLPTVAENLALDEALLDDAEETDGACEILRLWESPQTAVIVGRSSRLAAEVNLLACAQAGIPVLRRCSGGCAVVIGPGCLMYSVVLSYAVRPQLHLLEEAHRFVLERVKSGLSLLVDGISLAGTSDLAWQGRKFSGNSVRCKRSHLLYHGTILYDFPLPLVSRCLLSPPRQPEYRDGRSHDDFLINLSVPPEKLAATLRAAFGASDLLPAWPQDRLQRLLADRYGRAAWHQDR